MNYELAKKLKDAGFPQGDYSDSFQYCTSNRDIWCDGVSEEFRKKSVLMPSLSELIEACGDGFTDLVRENIEPYGILFYTNPAINAKGEKVLILKYKTPEEAVANLWLELNKIIK